MTTRIDADPSLGTITLKQLRDFLAQFPDRDDSGEPHQVLVQTGFAESSPVQCVTLVGPGCDVLLQVPDTVDLAPG